VEGVREFISTNRAYLELRFYNPAQVNPPSGGWIVWGIVKGGKLRKKMGRI
jgi:hypothetical protein